MMYYFRSLDDIGIVIEIVTIPGSLREMDFALLEYPRGNFREILLLYRHKLTSNLATGIDI